VPFDALSPEVACEMLAGRHPYNGNTAQEAHRAGLEPARIADMSDRQWRALEHALAVQRDDRTPNVAQFLVEFGVTRGETARRSGGRQQPQRAAPACRRRACRPMRRSRRVCRRP
jgi:hypothetical protein